MNDCPMCHGRPCEAVAQFPIIRGFLLWFQKGQATVVGCVPCVRRELILEVPRSLGRILLLPPAWLAVPVFWFPILLIRAAMLEPEPEGVARVLRGEAYRSKRATWIAATWIFVVVVLFIGWVYFYG